MEGETFHETWNFSLNGTPFSLRNFKKSDEFCTRRYKSLVKYAKMIVNHFIAVISLILYSLWRIRINPSFPSFKISPTSIFLYSEKASTKNSRSLSFLRAFFFLQSGSILSPSSSHISKIERGKRSGPASRMSSTAIPKTVHAARNALKGVHERFVSS